MQLCNQCEPLSSAQPRAGLWSQIKRAPKASKKRKTFEVSGPAKDGAASLDARARQIFLYFQKYNYEVKETGETITFAGTYAASRGQAAALVFYVFCGEPHPPAPGLLSSTHVTHRTCGVGWVRGRPSSNKSNIEFAQQKGQVADLV